MAIDGGGLPLADYVEGLVHLGGCPAVRVENCEITGSTKNGLALDRCGGRVERNEHQPGAATPASAPSNRLA